jgi:hypothetical protein
MKYVATLTVLLVLFGGSRMFAGEVSVFDRLEQLPRQLEPTAPSNRAEKSLVLRAKNAQASALIPPSRRRGRTANVLLQGTLQEYVAAVVDFEGKPNLRLVTSGFVQCTKQRGHRCVAVVGDPCSLQAKKNLDGECEGMYLTVVVDVSQDPVALDQAVGGGLYIVRNQDDIEDLRAEAP